MHRGSVRAIAAIGVLIALAAAVLAVVSDVHVGVALGVRLPVAPGWINAAIGVAFSVSGAVLLWRAGPHPVAIVLAGAGVPVALLGAACGWVNLSAVTWRTAPAVDVALAGVERFGVLPVIVLPIALTFFPDARLPAGRPWRWSSVAGVVLLVGGVLIEALVPTPIAHAGFGGLDPRVRIWSRDWGIPLPEGVWEALLPAVPGLIVAGVVFALVGLVGRYPNGSARLRRQLRWILWAALVFLGCLLFGVFSQLWYLGQALLVVSIVAFCVAITAAVSRSRLDAVDTLLSWTIVYGLLLAAIIGVDVVLVAILGGLIDDRALLTAAVAIVFVAYAPARERLLGAVDRLVYGRRGDPFQVISSLSAGLESAETDEDQLEHAARSVAEAFASPYVAVSVDLADGARRTSSFGTPTGDPVVVPLVWLGEHVGELRMAPGRRRMSERDRRLLADLAQRTAAAVRAGALSRALQAHREQLVLAREAERHRVRRDLHDGLGPALAAAKLRIETARNLVGREHPKVTALLEDAATEVSAAVDDIRRVVHELRPAPIDDVGLVRAIEQQAERFGARVTAEAVPTGLPPAVEVAAYRIVSEALTNAHRHAAASRIQVVVRVAGGALVVQVEDDGAGIDPDAVAGVGLRSMRERATEIGGALRVVERHGGGTVVRAELPIGSPLESDVPEEALADA